VYDVPAFEGLYLNNKSYIYYCKYTAGAFRGASSASGKAIEFEVPYENSATELFDGRQRDYPGTVLIIAVAKPKYSFEGYGYSRLEFLLLKNGVQYLFVAIGFFLVSFAVAMYGGGARRRLEKYISTVVSWIYFEIKLAALILAVYLVSGASLSPFFISCPATQGMRREAFSKRACFTIYLNS
jgi:hypothetical protein